MLAPAKIVDDLQTCLCHIQHRFVSVFIFARTCQSKKASGDPLVET